MTAILLFLIIIIPFFFFQIPAGVKSFILFASFIFLIAGLSYYDYAVNFHNPHVPHGPGDGLGVSFMMGIIITSSISLISRGIALYFFKESRLKRMLFATICFFAYFLSLFLLRYLI